MIYSKDDVLQMLAKILEQADSWKRDFVKCPLCDARNILHEEITITLKDIEKTL